MKINTIIAATALFAISHPVMSADMEVKSEACGNLGAMVESAGKVRDTGVSLRSARRYMRENSGLGVESLPLVFEALSIAYIDKPHMSQNELYDYAYGRCMNGW